MSSQKRIAIDETIACQRPVLSMALSSPPVSPTKGDRYVVAATGSGAWLGKDNNIAWYDGSTWKFDAPIDGWLVYNQADHLVHNYTLRSSIQGWYALTLVVEGVTNIETVDPVSFIQFDEASGFTVTDAGGQIARITWVSPIGLTVADVSDAVSDYSTEITDQLEQWFGNSIGVNTKKGEVYFGADDLIGPYILYYSDGNGIIKSTELAIDFFSGTQPIGLFQSFNQNANLYVGDSFSFSNYVLLTGTVDGKTSKAPTSSLDAFGFGAGFFFIDQGNGMDNAINTGNYYAQANGLTSMLFHWDVGSLTCTLDSSGLTITGGFLKASQVILPGSSSGQTTLKASAIAASSTSTFPAVDTFIPIISQLLTLSGPSASRAYTLDDYDATLEGWVISKVSGSQFSTSNLTATDITGLSFAAAANKTYAFEAILYAQSSSGTAGCKYAVNFSAAGATAYAIYEGQVTGTTITVTTTSALATLQGTAYLTASAQTGVILIKGILITGANAGNFTIQTGKLLARIVWLILDPCLKFDY